MAQRTGGLEDLNEDFLLALKLSESFDQIGLAGPTGRGYLNGTQDRDYLLAMQLSQESLNSASGYGTASSTLDRDLVLALQLSEGVDQSRGVENHLESDEAFARRLQRELDRGKSPEVKKQQPTTVMSMNTSTNVAIVREWYTKSIQGQAPKIADLFQHLSSVDDLMLQERPGLQLKSGVKPLGTRFKPPVLTLAFKPPGTGFSGGPAVPPPVIMPLNISRKTFEAENDRKITAAFEFISANLYDFSSGEVHISKDRRIPVLPIVLAMLDLCLISEAAEMVLRSDSIKDLSDRIVLVRSLLRLLKTMSLRAEYRSILTRPRRLKKHTKGLQEIAKSPKGQAVTLVIVMEDPKEPMSQPLFHLLNRLKIQAEVFIKAARSSNDLAFQYGEDAASTRLCEQIVDVHDSILKTIGFTPPPLRTTITSTSTEKEKRLSLKTPWSSTPAPIPQIQVVPTPNTLDWSSAILDTHFFKQVALNTMISAPGRQPKLVRQITELTNLPEGIFVRVMEARPDVLKAIIVGPKDTPYEGGLFEFDIFAPYDFPNSPPSVILKTTGGGRVRFNPNLYADGKVCLSLINTWTGTASEQWQPATSTLLQVLVSIQSMIFVPCPYINEPGREAQAGVQASTQHKEFVRANTVRWGMVDWCTNSQRRDGVWKDVVRFHFLTRANQLRQLVRNSAGGNVGIRHYHGNASEDTLVRNFLGGMNLEKELDRCLGTLT